MRIRDKLILGFSALFFLSTFLGVYSLVQLEKLKAPLSTKIPENILEISQKAVTDRSVDLILYYDEIRTQSLRSYLTSHENQGEKRYYAFKAELDLKLNESLGNAKLEDKVFFTTLYHENGALTLIEKDALRKANELNWTEATKILEGGNYIEHKRNFNLALSQYRKKSGSISAGGFDAVTVLGRLEANNAKKEVAENFYLNVFALVVNFILSSAVIFLVIRSITNSLSQLTGVSKEIEKRNFAARVEIKSDDEFSVLANTLNDAIRVLGRFEKEQEQIEKAKTQFLSITSHELRSPMTPMKAQLQMLRDGFFGKLGKKQKDSIKIALKNTERLDKLLIDLLEVSRIEAGRLNFEFKKTSIAKLVNEVAQYMKGYIPGKNVSITQKVNGLGMVEVDPDRLSQVLRNLIGNAIKFSGKNCEIVITAKTQGDHLLFSVKDNGIGVSKENHEKLFSPFFQVDKSFSRAYSGTGLGLTISKGIIEAQNGKLWVESELGKWSIFYFTIPLRPSRSPKSIKLLVPSAGEGKEVK